MKGSGLGYFSAVMSVRTISSGKILKCVSSPHLACVKQPRQQNDQSPFSWVGGHHANTANRVRWVAVFKGGLFFFKAS